MIHGDIKPQNVLVYKDAAGETSIKVADFGYSTFAASETFATDGDLFQGAAAARVYLPKSRPWNAPEHHFGEFTVSGAKKTDVYSFGMLCLWVLFGSTHAECMPKDISFDASTGPHTSLEQLKESNQLETVTNNLVDLIPLVHFSAEHRIRLKEIFNLTVQLNSENRASDLGRLVGLLQIER